MPNPALYEALETAARERIGSHPLNVDRAVRIGLRQLRMRMLITYATGLAAASVVAITAVATHFALTAPAHLSAGPVPTIASTSETPSTTATSTTTETPSTTTNPTTAETQSTPTDPTTPSGTTGVKPQTLAAITVAPREVTLAQGSTQQLRATGTYTDGSAHDITNDVDWTTDDPAVAAVGRDGLVTAVAGGPGRPQSRTAIRATIAERSASVAIIVMPHDLTGISIQPPTIQSCAGSYTLVAAGTYSDGTAADLTDVQWTSDDSDFASVTQRGQLTVKTPRPNPTLRAIPRNLRAVITATASGQTARAVVECVRSESSTSSTPPTSSATPTTPPAASPTRVPTTPSSAASVPLR